MAWSRYSFIGVRSSATLVERDGVAVWLGSPPAGVPTDGDPVEVLRETVAALAGPAWDPAGGLPPLTGGHGRLPRLRPGPPLRAAARADRGRPRRAGAGHDARHRPGGARPLRRLGDPGRQRGAAAAGRAGPGARGRRRVPPRGGPARRDDHRAVPADPADDLDGGAAAGRRRWSAVRPTVATRRRSRRPRRRSGPASASRSCSPSVSSGPTDADPLDVYRVLRTTNPSPYMYLLRFDGFDIVGSSPEAHLKVSAGADGQRRALLHPIAGTRPRGRHPGGRRPARRRAAGRPEGARRARHAGRPGPQRPGPGLRAGHRRGAGVRHDRAVQPRHAHRLDGGRARCATTGRAFDALAATFPAGTLSGAPKVRAMEIIEELEPVRRGLYGGTVGYFGFGGDLDMAIAIRTALMRDGRAYVQAGAGVVADSDPAAEEQETRNKAAAVLAAIAAAETLRAGPVSAGASADRADGNGSTGMSVAPRRPLTYAVLLCLAGAALVLFAATRDLAAGGDRTSGAVAADRAGPQRRLADALVAGAGGRRPGRRRRGARHPGPAAAAAGRSAAGDRYRAGRRRLRGRHQSRRRPAVAGALCARRAGGGGRRRGHGRPGARWPAMGARYERAAGTPPPAVSSRPERVEAAGTRDAWDALDRGEDPTAG